jgi:Flp pilus assembly protein TadG
MVLSLRDRMMAFRRLATRLAGDTRGNVLVIVAAAVVPLIALVGSGVDMSRAYMAQARLQMACDAGALAGRRVMVASTVDANVRAEALKFFRFNFPTGESGTTTPYGVATFTPTVPDGTDGTVKMNASTTVPTTLMAMFGKQNIEISATCFARQDFVNTDIVLVLDTTGSMSADVNGNEQNSGPTSKIVALRSAVLALYDELAPVQTQLQTAGLRLRYGVVPYSISVNAGDAIKSVNPNYIVQDQWTYQSRVANMNTPLYTPQDTALSAGDPLLSFYTPGTQRFKVAGGVYNATGTDFSISDTNCGRFGANNNSFSVTGASFNPSPSGSALYDPDGPAGLTATAPSAPTAYVKYTFARQTTSWSNNPATRVCDRTVTASRRTYTTSYTFTNWTYKAVPYDVSNFVAGNAVSLFLSTSNTTGPTGSVPNSGSYDMQALISTPGSTVPGTASTWKGCIEERNTNSSINTSTTSIPSNAYDLDIDAIPTDNNTRWRPHWPEVVHTRNSSGSSNPTADANSGSRVNSSSSTDSWACPGPVKRLQAWTRSDLSTYLATLQADGYTYHDIGMIWGGRVISPDGIFSGDNPSTYNSMPVARYIIYMTDGALNTIENGYSSYGVEYLDKRVTGGYTTSADQDNRHNQRFALACQAAKSKGVSIWVVAFASSLSTQLTNCASKSSQASVSSNSAALIAKFAEIGKNIGSLRLTQ